MNANGDKALILDETSEPIVREMAADGLREKDSRAQLLVAMRLRGVCARRIDLSHRTSTDRWAPTRRTQEPEG